MTTISERFPSGEMLALDQYDAWMAFTVNGVQFLALITRDGAQVVDSIMQNFGKWRSIESFRKEFKNKGYDLCLGGI